MRTLKDLAKKNLTGKVCLLRVDFNVESAKDALRLEASLPTMKWLLAKGARLVLLSHRGRPRGIDPKLSLKEFASFLQKNLKERVLFLNKIPSELSTGKVYLVENLRFWPEEERDDAKFARRLASLGDFYVNDAFAVCHRKNSSVTQLPKLLPSYAGLLLEREIKTLTVAMKNPKKPLVLIFGGAKVADKLPVIKNLLSKANKVLIGSSVLNNPDPLPESEKVIKPIDWIKKDNLVLDIGPLSAEEYVKEIKKAKTIIWNGPVGKFEDKRYIIGSRILAKAVAASKAFSIIGGGETTQLILSLGLRKKIGFLSTGGGAMLEFLAGENLPGIAVLR
ncbi:MAG: phosphoglycerate kinase [Parcubacteria group bacterium Gr01-1014_19]|nr:MAG: phosphoglycerate kinase [Parcubacteria group bacterium Gr01-1014_19]